MSDQPKPVGEWTHEKLQGLLQINNEDRYVADHAFENTLDEINAALAAERENTKQLVDALKDIRIGAPEVVKQQIKDALEKVEK